MSRTGLPSAKRRLVKKCSDAQACEVGSAIRGYRRASGLTQQQLAKVAGVSLGLVRDLEQGRTRSPRWGTVQALASALGLDDQDRVKLVASWEPGGRRQADLRQSIPAQAVNVRILGSLVAERSGRLIGLGPARRRVVLAVLALRWPGGARQSELIDLLWPGDAPSGAAGIIQAHVGHLRRLLKEGNVDSYQPIAWSDGSYQLKSGPLCRLDKDEFVSLVRDGDRALAANAPARACDLYERALGLWRGEVVADLDCLREHPVVAALDRQRSDVVLQYATAAESAGDRSRALRHLLEACSDEPLSEVLHARLIAVLGSLGRRSEAVREFERLQRRLGTELGIGPSELVWWAYKQAVGL